MNQQTTLYLGVAGLILILMSTIKNGQANTSPDSGSARHTAVHRTNPWKLPDIDSSVQASPFKTDFDESFEKAQAKTKVPFALLKAHALRESNLDPGAYRYDNERVGSSYGLMQVEWIQGSNRFEKYGITDDQIGDGSLLYDPDTNCYLGACIIRDNLDWLKGNLRDAVNAYNTGVRESKRQAPNHYVDDVIGYYSQILGEQVS